MGNIAPDLLYRYQNDSRFAEIVKEMVNYMLRTDGIEPSDMMQATALAKAFYLKEKGLES